MSTAVIADAHIGGPGGPPEPLIGQLRELGDGPCRHLILLGDLFHVWVGDRRYETPEIRAVVEALSSLKDKGIRLDYVEGNRDFFIGRGPYADLFEQVGSEVDFTAAGKRYLAVHGDGLNDADYLYRFWHWLSKSRLSRFMMHNLPSPVARAAVHQTEHQLAKTNFKHKTHIPEKVILDYARRRLGTDYDVLILGHFHEPRTWQVNGGEVHLLDAWYRSQRIEWYAEF